MQTVDYITPVVDDAADWGRIAAANCLSDVYAMGGTPLTAMQIIGWPRDELSFELLGDVIDGAVGVLQAAGCTLVGGHSIDDPEPKFGLALTGVVHPDEVITNGGAEAGDVMVLTKPLGSGIASTAMKRDDASDELIKTMSCSSRRNRSTSRRTSIRSAGTVSRRIRVAQIVPE